MIARRIRSSAFTLTEMIATMCVLAVFGVFLTSVLGGSMGAVRNTERTLKNGSAIHAFSSIMGEDLAAFQPSTLPGRRCQLSIEQSDTGVRVTIIRPATRVRNLELAGYTSQIIYSWDRQRQEVTRTEYNSAKDRTAAGRTEANPNGFDHEANNRRAAALAPAWESENATDWLDDDRLARLDERSRAIPLLTGVRSFDVTSFKNFSLTELASDNDSEEGDSAPVVMRFRMELGGDGTPAVRPVEILLPIGSSVAPE